MEINPTKPQYDYIMSEAANPAMVAGFGAGKSEAATLRSIIGKLKHPKLNRGFYLPTWDLVRMIAWPRFEKILTELDIPYKLYKSPLNYIEIVGYGRIYFRSMEVPEKIVGYEHADCDIDELDTLKRDHAAYAFRQIKARNRQKKPQGELNTIGVTTTPEGFRFVYETWAKDPAPGYEIIQAPTYSNPHLPENYIDELRAIYPDNLLQAYIEGHFVNLTTGTVYCGYNRERNKSRETIRDKELLCIGMDFNVTNMSAVVYVMRGNVWHAVKEYKGVYDTPEMIRIIKDNHREHSIRVYPDATGRNRKSVDASSSDIALLEQAGFLVYYNASNPRVRDRINAANAAFDHKEVMINEIECPEYARCLEQLAYDKNGEPDKNSNLDHLPDAGTYPIAFEKPIIKPVANVAVQFAM
jgi:phage terminase large subunit